VLQAIEVEEPRWVNLHEKYGMNRREKKNQLQVLIDTMESHELGQMEKKIFGGRDATTWAFITRVTKKAAAVKKGHKPIKHSVTVCEFWRRCCRQPLEDSRKTPKRKNGCRKTPCHCNFWNDVVCQQPRVPAELDVFQRASGSSEPPPSQVGHFCKEGLSDEDKKSQLKAFIENDNNKMDSVENHIGKDKTIRTFIERHTTQAKNNQRSKPLEHSVTVCRFWRETYGYPLKYSMCSGVCDCDFWNEFVCTELQGVETRQHLQQRNTIEAKSAELPFFRPPPGLSKVDQ